jgi:hypothetical protein
MAETAVWVNRLLQLYAKYAYVMTLVYTTQEVFKKNLFVSVFVADVTPVWECCKILVESVLEQIPESTLQLS